MMRRDPAGAATDKYDLIVVGGGIYGACLTLESARRGLRTLLLERDDFGGATSWNSLRIIHGGLRYLQRLDLRRYRESVAERRWFLRHFPDEVEPLSCLMPLYGRGLRRPSVLAAALALDDRLSSRRNDGVRADRRLGPGRVIDPDQAVELYPTIDPAGLRGAALWTDARMPRSPRVLMEILRWSAAAGARALNYFEATDLIVDDGRVVGITALDRDSGQCYEFETRRVANCAGPWSRELSERFDREVPELFRPTVAFNLLLDREPPADLALAVSPPDESRSYFVVPWQGRLMAGTCHAAQAIEPSDLTPDHPLVREFANDLGAATPKLGLESATVLRVLAGRLPAATGGGATPTSRPVIVEHGKRGGPRGLVSVSGVKYTTARALAERTLGVLFGKQLAATGDVARPEPAAWPALSDISQSEGRDSTLAARLGRLATDESVRRLEDLTLRRTDIGLDPERGAAATEWLRDIVETSTSREPGS